MHRQDGRTVRTAADDAAYDWALRVARETIADALREGTTFEELEGGLLERRLAAPPRRGRKRPRPRRRGDQAAYRPLGREAAQAAR
jgi:hypothetical protein